MTTTYHKRLGLLHNPAVAREIASLDAERDVQRIVHLLAIYEFSWDFKRALEVALFYTYGSASVSRLLDRTGEFEKYGQKRYDDTALLIGHFIESGWDGEVGRQALARMNQTHAHYAIANDDFLFVLWTFIEFPIRWTDRYGRRRMTAHEQRAWFNFWAEIGRRMGLKDIPSSKAEFDAFTRRYEAQHFVYALPNHRVATATVRIMANWLPAFLHPAVRPVVCALMPRHFLDAVGFPDAPGWRRALVSAALKLVGAVNRLLPFGHYPHLVRSRSSRTYQDGYRIEDLRPVHLNKHEAAQTVRQEPTES
ncbi:DUF2236 domain-containing protein [Pseudomonas sp. UL073]|uniref:DUF2236 domain-containing protein n=1 Tax=Zestomonas insulae TaxID=2809017 RepID=A0ABS2IAW3_9GAMM|nr:oxygenase MpaB family protein [Pseudomonas insulae]MBM7060259.1 DUF2236 domain-containing protein [Pseudomonas insulae]